MVSAHIISIIRNGGFGVGNVFRSFMWGAHPFAETSLLLRATRQLILGSGFFNQSFQIKKGKNIIIKWSGSTYFSNKDVPDISAWICFMTWKLIWNPSSFKTCQKNDVKTYTVLVMVSFSLSRLHHPKTPPSEIRGVWTHMEKWLRSPFI